MSTSIQGRQGRGFGLEDFADITSAPVLGFDADGILFDGDLTTDEAIAVWWRWTSKDDADEACRRSLSGAVTVEMLRDYLLGMEGS